MDLDDLNPRPKVGAVASLGEDLSKLSVADLEQRLAALDREKTRVSDEIARRRKQANAADALFKKS